MGLWGRMGRMGQIICPKESATCRERDDASMFHVEHSDRVDWRAAGGRWAARSSKSCARRAGSRGAHSEERASKQRLAVSRIANRGKVGGVLTAFCLLPT